MGFGLKPLVVRLYPNNQTEEEDFYWWSYPPHVNKAILQYLKNNNLKVKKLVRSQSQTVIKCARGERP